MDDKINKIKKGLLTGQENTWCPGCPDFMTLEAVKNALAYLISNGLKQENIVMSNGIGCFTKIFDYLNIGGFYGLHGRVIPVAIGMSIGNPNLTILGFAGDGDAYSEGMGHFIQAGRYNANITYMVSDNQSFSLTTGQSTPTSQKGFKNKLMPLGEFNKPLNPVKLALASNASFVARTNARNIKHSTEILKKAILHKGFSFVEIIQDCIIFNLDMNNKDNIMYEIPDNLGDMKKAEKYAGEWDYNSKSGKIPIGIIFKEERPTFTDKWPQLKKLKQKKIGWKNFR